MEENILSMDELRIRALIDVLDLVSCAPKENPDLWKWLTGQEQPPEVENMKQVFSAVRSKVLRNLDGHACFCYSRCSWRAVGKRMIG